MPLFSVIVLCYRNFEYLQEAIDSVLAQTYPEIELIVSDDCSPGFPQAELESYIAGHGKENIRSFLVRQEATNSGTVKHINHAIQQSKGEYIIIMAADDAFYSDCVLEQYAEGFREEKMDCGLLVAQTVMCDQTLKVFEEYYLDPTVQAILEKKDYAGLYDRLCYSACLPTTSTCYTRSLFARYGLFDERYSLVEDYPMHLRIARERIPIAYRNFIANKHRSGGISHGAQKALSASKRLYYQDILRSHREILSARAQDRSHFRKLLGYEFSHQKIWLDYQLCWRAPGWAGKLKLPFLHPVYSFLTFLEKLTAPLMRLDLSMAGCVALLAICGCGFAGTMAVRPETLLFGRFPVGLLRWGSAALLVCITLAVILFVIGKGLRAIASDPFADSFID